MLRKPVAQVDWLDSESGGHVVLCYIH